MVQLSDPSIKSLYGRPMPAARTGPLANAFSYPTKISPESIALFIATHTAPGEAVLDVFGGSGSTGLAAMLCDVPTDWMKSTAKDLSLRPRWGPRNAVVGEIGTLGAFIANTMCHPPDTSVFMYEAAELIDRVEGKVGWVYDTLGPDGEAGTIRHTIWSEYVECPTCGTPTSYWDAAVRWEPLRLSKDYTCRKCGTRSTLKNIRRVTQKRFDPLLGVEVEERLRLPARVHGTSSSGTTWKRLADDNDLASYRKVVESEIGSAPVAALRWGDLYRSGYHHGMTHLHHLYSYRNFKVMAELWRAVDDRSAEVRDALRFLILSFNAAHATLMTRVVVKKGQGDFSLTGAQTGVMYVSGLPVEKNIFSGLRRKTATISRAFEQISSSRSHVTVLNSSSTELDLDDDSVDYVFTDPPFGGYIPYAELNQVNELWLGKTTDRSEEVVVSPSQDKTTDDYGRLLSDVFREVARVLKDSGAATIVFHSSKADVWQALKSALDASRLRPVLTSVLDKVQSSFKQASSSNSVKGDPLILVSKSDSLPCSNATQADEIVDATIAAAALADDPSELSRHRLYSRFTASCLEAGAPVSFDAAEFYRLVCDRIAPTARGQ